MTLRHALFTFCVLSGCSGFVSLGDVDDSGEPLDASSPDSGGPNDAGQPPDAGNPTDAGTDAGRRDAGPPFVSDGGIPLWAVGLTVNEWREIPNSALTLQPAHEARRLDGGAAVVGPIARLDAWCGLSIDTRSSTVWAAANGGHGDYYGNDVMRFDLLRDAPQWLEWFAGSNGNVVDDLTAPTDPSHAWYRDGLPVSTHSYYGQQYLERQNMALRLGGSTAPVGSAFENVEGFDTSVGEGVNGWAPPGTFGYALGGVNGGWTPAIGWAATKDPVTENVYVVNAPYIRRFTPAVTGSGGTWSVLSTLPVEINTGALGATAVDTTRNRLVWLKGYGPNTPYTVDLATGVWSAQAHPPNALKPEFDALKVSLGMVYVPQLDAYLVRANAAGDRVYRIDAATFELSALPTVGGASVPQGAKLNDYEENVYTKWLLVPALRGIVYFPRASSNAWFLRLY